MRPRLLHSAVAVCVLATLTLALCACQAQVESKPPAPVWPTQSDRREVIAHYESEVASEALRAFLDSWGRHFNERVLGSDVGTNPMDAALAVPMDQPGLVTFQEYTIVPTGESTRDSTTYDVTFRFWGGNPLSSTITVGPMESQATYRLIRNEALGGWNITLASDPPDRGLREVENE